MGTAPGHTHILAEDVLGSPTHHKEADFNKSCSGVLLLSGSIGSLFTHQLVGNNSGQPKPSSRLVEIQPYPPAGPEPATRGSAPAPNPLGPTGRVTRSQLCSPGQCQSWTPPPPSPDPSASPAGVTPHPQSETAPEAGPRGQREIKETIPFIICSKKDNTSELI